MHPQKFNFLSTKVFYLAKSYSLAGKRAGAYALYSCALSLANAAVRQLVIENAEIRSEMEAFKLSASDSVTTCLEVAKKEKKSFRRLLAWERQKTQLQATPAEYVAYKLPVGFIFYPGGQMVAAYIPSWPWLLCNTLHSCDGDNNNQRNPAWVDEKEEKTAINIAKEDETVISCLAYASRLRAQHERLFVNLREAIFVN